MNPWAHTQRFEQMTISELVDALKKDGELTEIYLSLVLKFDHETIRRKRGYYKIRHLFTLDGGTAMSAPVQREFMEIANRLL